MSVITWPLSEAPRCERLRAASLETYRREGYVIVPDAFSGAEVEALNAEIDRLQAEDPKAFGRSGLYQLGLRSPLTEAVCRDERILTLIEDIVKPGIAIYSAKMVQKPANDDFICHWHQDNAYYNPKAASDCRMSIWLALQDTDESNGCLWVVPGSHREGTHAAERRGSGHCDLAVADGRAPMEGAIPVPMSAGALLLFDAHLLHRSLGNGSDRPRRSFIVSYQEATAVCGNGQQHKILRPAPGD